MGFKNPLRCFAVARFSWRVWTLVSAMNSHRIYAFVKKNKKIKPYGRKPHLSKLKLSANWCNIGFLNLQRKSSSACAAPPSQRCQRAPTDYQDLNLFSSGTPCRAEKPNNPPNFTLKLAKARIGGRNGHWSDSQELKILKKGGWRKGWVTEIACLLPLPEKQGGWGILKWEHTSFFPCGYQEVDRKRKTCSGSTARNGSFTLNKHLLAIKMNWGTASPGRLLQ